MGFDRKSPKRPPYNPNLRNKPVRHKHIYWDEHGNKQKKDCMCDTGRNHTTPRGNNGV